MTNSLPTTRMGDGRQRRRAERHEAGFTVVECVLSFAIVSVLLLACASVVTLTLRSEAASRVTDSPSAQNIQACRAANQLAEELRVAQSFSEVTPTAVTFKVPDRNGDGYPETIRYAWSGPGMQLIRWQNGLPASGVTVADNVDLLELTIPRRTVGPPAAAGAREGSEVTFCTSNQTGTTELGIDKSNWAGGYFKPTLPANTISWRITRAQFQIRRGQGPGPILVSIYRADANLQPTGTPLETVSFAVSSLPVSAGWVDVSFSSLKGLDPRDSMVFVIGCANSGQTSGYALYKTFVLTGVAGMSWTTTTNGGTSWTGPLVGGVLLNKAMQLAVYGTITVQP